MDIRPAHLLAAVLSFVAVAAARAGDPPPLAPDIAGDLPPPDDAAPPVTPDPAPPLPEAPPAPEPLAPANGDPATAPPTPTNERARGDRWVGWLPAQQTWVQREEVLPAASCERQVPVFETVKVPTYEERQVPIHQDVEVPVFSTREVEVYDTLLVPEYGEVEVTVYEARSTPVRVSLPNPFSCECRTFDVKLWNRCERVPVGTRHEQGIVGWRTDRAVVGTRTETFQSGTETRRTVVGWRTERVQVGEREESRQVGWRAETVALAPERRRVVHDCVAKPARLVTVTDGDPATTAPLPGTTEVVDEATFARAQANAGR